MASPFVLVRTFNLMSPPDAEDRRKEEDGWQGGGIRGQGLQIDPNFDHEKWPETIKEHFRVPCAVCQINHSPGPQANCWKFSNF